MAPMTLREARTQQDLSQRGLAERAGVARVTVSHIELGKSDPRPHTARRLSAALGVEARYIVEFYPVVMASQLRQPTIRPLMGRSIL
ncbi:MAG: helix-turn-helix domain-containing protein [Chloroflexota bacterium]|nr:helix-turn-helix domain-containing protein [Chloroflexota bacterium]